MSALTTTHLDRATASTTGRRIARLWRFVSDIHQRLADSPLNSPVIGALRPVTHRMVSQPARTAVVITLVCDRSAEALNASRLRQSLRAAGLVPTVLPARHPGDGSAHLRVTVSVLGDPATALEPVISGLFLRPGVRDLRWHREQDSAPPAATATAA